MLLYAVLLFYSDEYKIAMETFGLVTTVKAEKRASERRGV